MFRLHADNVLVRMNDRDAEKIKDFLHVSFFILIQVLVITEYIFSPKKGLDIFWFCNHVSIIYAYALYTHRPQMVVGVMQVGIFVQIVWLISFTSHIIGIGNMDTTAYMFEGSFDYAKMITLIVHILLPTSIIWLLRKERPRLISLLYSAVYCCFLYVTAHLFTPREENINCVFNPCTVFVPKSGYTVLWPFYAGIMVCINHGIYRLSFRLFARKPEKASMLYLVPSK